MKAKLDFRSKRTIIITAIIATLAIGAGVGAYFYAKGNNEASATTNLSDSSQTATDQAPSGENNQGNPASNDNNGNENGGTNTQTDGTGDNTGDNGTANNGADANGDAGNAGNGRNEAAEGTGNGGAAGGDGAGAGNGAGAGAQVGDADDGDATTTTENIIVEEPWESHSVNWRPQTLNVSTPEVSVNENKIVVTKNATTSTGYNSVSEGDTIIYTITVTNNNSDTLNSLYISDEIPEGTTFDTAENGGKTIKENDVVTKVYWNLWNLGIEPGKTYSVSFKVIVNKGTKGTIKNVAIAEDEPSNKDENGEPTPTKNPVIKSNKTASLVEMIKDEEGNEDEKITELTDKDKVKEGQIVRYTITVENTSKDEKATTKVSDSVPEGTTLQGEKGEEVTVINGKKTTTYAIATLNEGIELTIEKEGKASIYFDVKVNKDTPKYIRNIATVGNETPTTENEVYTDIEVTKIWDDDDNQDGKRPDEITVILNKTIEEKTEIVKEAILTAENEWKYSFKDLPKYDGENEIIYTVEETKTNVVTGTDAAGTYKVEVTGDYKTGITITNTHTPEKISVNATKVYDDNNDQDGIREDATFNLYKKVGNSDKEQVANSTKTISKDATGEGLVATWSNLPKYENGNEIEYSVEEELTDRVTGKDAAGTYKVETKGDYKTGITITNKHTPEKINISVNKKWITKDATTSMPNKLIVKLMNGKNEVETVELNEDNKWKHTFANKDKCSNGKNINYTIEEESVKGFYQSDLDKNVDKDGNVTYTLTNSPSLEIEKKSPTDGDTIEVGKNITYTVTITNHNDIPETTKLQESIPENTKLVGDIEITATGESKITTKTMPTDITVPANGKTTIKFTVEVQNSALGSGNTITNTAKIGENENIISSETIKNNAQKELKIYQVETENQGQTVVVVIDMSLSMASAINPAINSDTMAYAYNQTRWFYLTEALDTFIEEFLSNSNNRISIVGYNANTTKLCDFTNNKNTAKNSYKNVFTQTHFNNLQKAAQCGNVAFNAQKEGSFQTDLSSSPDGYNIDVDALTYLGNGKWSKTVTVGSGADRVTYTAGQKIPGATETTECLLGSGTNITKGLSAANSELENNVIYTSVVLMTDGEANRDKGNEATNAASIRAKGADLYTIGFTSDVKTLESTVGSANITKNYTATTANQLSNAFEDIAGKITNLPVVTKTTTTGTVNISDINIKNDSDVEIIAKVNGTEKKIFDGKGSTFKSTYMTGNTFNFKQLLIDKNVDPDSEITMTINTEI